MTQDQSQHSLRRRGGAASCRQGAYINGLFMSGARWDDDNMCVEDSFPKAWPLKFHGFPTTPLLLLP